jgi:hypothetical protein
MESGEEVPQHKPMSLKNRSAAKTKNKASRGKEGDLETFDDITEGDE